MIIIGMVIKYELAYLGALIIGFGLSGIIYAGYNISGAHYNPMVTIGLLIMKRISPQLAGLYILTQLVAAATGAAFCNYLQEPTTAFSLADSFGILISEIVGTFLLVFVIFTTAASKRNAGNHYYGFAIGVFVAALAIIFGKSSGAAFNPAVAFSFVFMQLIDWSSYFIILPGILIGGIPATLLFNRIENDYKA